jgi:putative inorganic carbon (HCO3(-)) transporter
VPHPNNPLFAMPASATALSAWTRHGTGLALLLVIAANFFVRGGHDVQRALEVAFLLASGGAMLARTGTLGAALPSGKVLRYSLAGFFVLGTLSSLAAFSPRLAFYEVASLMLLLLVGLSVAGEIAGSGADSMLRVLQALGAICLLYGFKIGVIYVTAFAIGAQPDAIDFTPGFNNYRFFNHAQTTSLPLLVLLFALAPRGSRIRWAWLLLAAFWWALMAVTSARGSVAGLAAGCAVALALRGRHAFAFLKATALSVAVGAAIYVVFFKWIPQAAGFLPFGELARVVERSVADPGSGRQYLWRLAAELIAAHPLLGTGPLHFAHYAAKLSWGAHPHDWVLQIAAEWGVPALLCLAAAIGAGGLALVRVGKRVPDGDLPSQDILTALIVAGAAVLVDGLVSGVLVMPQSQLMIVLYIGCAAGWSRSFGSAGGTAAIAGAARSRAGAAAVLAAVLVGAMLALGNGVWPEVVARLRQDPLTAEQQAANPGTSWPRLWSEGYF